MSPAIQIGELGLKLGRAAVERPAAGRRLERGFRDDRLGVGGDELSLRDVDPPRGQIAAHGELGLQCRLVDEPAMPPNLKRRKVNFRGFDFDRLGRAGKHS